MANNYISFNDLSSYKKSYALSNYVWAIVLNWNQFARDTIGKQFVRAVDSISANIAEGYGRYSKNDKVHFYHISRGSLAESTDWNTKAQARNLLSPEQHLHIKTQLDDLPKEINQLIKYTKDKLSI